MSTGDRIKQQRLKKGLKLREIAEKAAISPSFLSDIENNKSSAPLKRLSTIAAALDCSVSFLLGEEDGIHEYIESNEILDTVVKELRDFKDWSVEDQGELVVYLKAKREIRKAVKDH